MIIQKFKLMYYLVPGSIFSPTNANVFALGKATRLILILMLMIGTGIGEISPVIMFN
jgi:hypothetical protein